MSEIARLFEPVAIGNAVLRNRLAMLAMGTQMGDGPRVNEAVKAFYRERARGGVGLIMVGMLSVADVQPVYRNQIAISDDSLVPGLRELVAVIHAEGAKAFAQVVVMKHWRESSDLPVQELAPSDVKLLPHCAPRPATVDEIHEMTRYLADGARRAKEAGFDGIELHAATGEFVSLFLSPLTNKRTDEYGGSFENRVRILLEIVAAAREAVGPDYPLTCKIGGDDFMKGGNKLPEARQIARLLEDAGLQGLNVAAGWHESPEPLAVSMVPQGGFVYLAEAVKAVVQIPVMATYRIASPHVAAKVIAEGKAELVGMARAFLADPEWPNKAREGRLDEIRPCTACCVCLDQAMFGKPIVCAVNPFVGREAEDLIHPAANAKKVFVAGGGPGGLQAAVTAAGRGHKVTLFEKSSRLGGQLGVASVPPYQSEIGDLAQHLALEAKRVGVAVHLSQELTASAVEVQRPDVVIVATGPATVIPDIPGVGGAHVVTAQDVLSGARPAGQRVVVFGGGMVGCYTALFLAERGNAVTVVEPSEQVAGDVGPSNRWVVKGEIKKAGVAVLTKSSVERILPAAVMVKTGAESRLIDADTIVLANNPQANTKLAAELEGKTAVYTLGDCVAPRRIREAIAEGLQVGARV